MRKVILNSVFILSVFISACKKNDTDIEPISIPNPERVVVGNWKVIETNAVGNLTVANATLPAEGFNSTPPSGYYNLFAGENGAKNTYTYDIKASFVLQFGKNGNIKKNYDYDDKDSGTWELKSDQHIVFHGNQGNSQDVFFTKYDSSNVETLQLSLPVDTTLDGVNYEGKIIVDLIKNK